MKYRSEARRKMMQGRLWTVYAPTGDPKRPLRPIACVRANAKSIAAGKAVEHLNPRLSRFRIEHAHIRKAKRHELVVVEGCYTGGPVLRGARKRRRRR